MGAQCLIARLSLHQNQGHNHETHLSTLGRPPQAHPRFPRSHAHQGWPQGHRRASRQGPSPSGCLSPEHGTAAGAGGACEPDCRFGFPKRYRLTKTDEYSSVFGFRRALRGQHFLLHYRPREVVDGGENRKLPARLGVVVPKKLVKAAVRRNLIKRLAREQFRLSRTQLPSFDLVLRLATKPGKPDRKGLATEILELLRKVGQPRSSGKRN